MILKTKEEVLRLIKGATLLASGGGGPFFLAKNIIEYYLDKTTSFHDIHIINSTELKENDWSCIAAGMAEPSKGASLSPQDIVGPTISAVENMEILIQNYISKGDQRFQDFKKFNALVPIEVGAINVTIPLMTALQKNLPVVNGDPSGRSVPTINLTTFATTQPVMPNMASAVDKNKFTILSLKDYKDLGTAYSKMIDSGLIGIDTGLCLSPMKSKALNTGSLVNGTLEDAYNIGKVLEEDINSIEKINKIKFLLSKSKSPRKMKHICTGEVIDYFTKSVNDNDLGYLKIRTNDKRIFTILIQNENIIGQYNDETNVYITGPDSICYLSTKNGSLDNVYDIIDNVVIEMMLEKGEKVDIHILAIEASSIILNNTKLMKNWEVSYQTSNYFGTYNSKLWDIEC